MSTRETKPESRISALLGDRIEAGDFPSAVYVVAERGQAVFADALGDAALEPEKRPATLDTIYDLASLTKPLVTGLLCARLVERGALNIDDRVAEHLPEFDREDKRDITIKHLLTHASGLAAWRPIYLLAKDKADALAAIAEQPLESGSRRACRLQRPRLYRSRLSFAARGWRVAGGTCRRRNL